MDKVIGCLRLMRPPNLLTAVADVLAGIAIAMHAVNETSGFSWMSVILLVAATIGLYGGGVVFNDVFDAKLDQEERPERPIPSGLISIQTAVVLGTLLLIAGIMAASSLHTGSLLSESSGLAIVIAVLALVYDKWMKHHPLLGPLNMGICRGLNLMLGMSIIPATIPVYGVLAVVPVIYIAAVTMISRGEVHGGKKSILTVAGCLYLIVLGAIVYSAFINGYFWHTAAYLFLFAALIFPPLLKAFRNPAGIFVGKAVKAGVIALIAMNAAWAAAFGMMYFALAIILLLPVSLLLAKLFAVT